MYLPHQDHVAGTHSRPINPSCPHLQPLLDHLVVEYHRLIILPLKGTARAWLRLLAQFLITDVSTLQFRKLIPKG